MAALHGGVALGGISCFAQSASFPQLCITGCQKFRLVLHDGRFSLQKAPARLPWLSFSNLLDPRHQLMMACKDHPEMVCKDLFICGGW